MISEFGYLLLFILAAILLVLLVLGIARLLRPNRPSEEKNEVYESGELPVGDARVSFNIRYYIVGIIFLLFEVELVLLFPWSTVFGDVNQLNDMGVKWLWFAGFEILLFIGLLALGLVYVWKEGLLDWVMPAPENEEVNSPVPGDLYEALNQKYARKS
ncbi:NADH dehydrogenase subunit A [Leadbetterella byssophila DSM 17132]|uniref:NADH-quinone oxidoreductase subunit A n=1 Tax=Leadbetterella byssophila (strain DSM 17132 / JCM 16389 / KACC 11308 / NBRC 106382 / 4M15) TaxID=649349 RepID=E4RVH7_LEAB4|nr:NADH-quinone oxidoreductase subunit A [Leadbetterella byssophila]ADQ17041.1 NADH dehydrogenase subunit A [Leadbetterella byssophila DSM 17132]